jgi:hypothetical protein
MSLDALQLQFLAIAVGWLQQAYRNSVNFILMSSLFRRATVILR